MEDTKKLSSIISKIRLNTGHTYYLLFDFSHFDYFFYDPETRRQLPYRFESLHIAAQCQNDLLWKWDQEHKTKILNSTKAVETSEISYQDILNSIYDDSN